MLNKKTINTVLLFTLLVLSFQSAKAQDQIKTGTNMGAPLVLAVPDFKQANADPGNGPLMTVFNDTLWNAPINAAMLAFGNLGVSAGKVSVQGWLFDTKNTQYPQVLGKQYQEDANVNNARHIAHEFANEIILKLGGIPGPMETKIYFISTRSGHKDVWSMDWDGAHQQQVTHLGGIALSPRISPDNSRLAFSELNHD